MSWGVFDSGVGGLTVFKALRASLPETPLVYLGDTARVPYGVRSVETVREYAREAAVFMSTAGVEGVIIACNTASAVALDAFRDVFRGSVLGVVEPGVGEALAATRRGRIGIIGTPATVRSDAYGARIRALRPDATVVSSACPLFVPLAEEGWTRGEVPTLVARRYLASLQEAGVDTVVLACTHYPLLREVIAEEMGPAVRLVDSASAVSREAVRRQESAQWQRSEPHKGARDRFCVTDAGGAFASVAERFLGAPIPSLETVHLPHSGA